MKKPKTFTPLASLSGETVPEPVTRESDKFMLRLPDGMRERIGTAAKKSGRSMNAEIVKRLEESLKNELPTTDNPIVATVLLRLNYDRVKALVEQTENHLRTATKEVQEAMQPWHMQSLIELSAIKKQLLDSGYPKEKL